MDRVQKGDGGEWQVFVRRQEPEGAWWQLADIPDKCPYAVLGTGALYLLSRRDAPRGKVLRLPLTEGATVADAEEIVPASDIVIEDLAVTGGTVWVADMDGGPQQLRAFDLAGRPLPTPEIPPVSSVSSYIGRPQPGWGPTGWPGRASRSPSRPRGGWPTTEGRPGRRPWRRPAPSTCPATR